MEESQIGEIGDKLQALTLSKPDHLLFKPPDNNSSLKEAFDNIPRYLFRVTTPKSDGTTDRTWVKSKDAKSGEPNSSTDVFARDSTSVAEMLNRHLRWCKGDNFDNFVSWTSSLLFAIQYIFYRRTLNSLDIQDIYLCIIDTLAFPRATFLKDMDLIDTYSAQDDALRRFRILRENPARRFQGYYYFGEYLSQGALKVDGNCSIVSARVIVDQGLFYLQSKLKESMLAAKTGWADAVLRLREPFYQVVAKRQQATDDELEAAMNIAQVFGRRFRLPMAANLLGLLPRQSDDKAILQMFASHRFTDHVEEIKTSLRGTVAIALGGPSDSTIIAKVTQGSEQPQS
ncbi:MAG: hypothetical protein Q9177_005302 [Variospora cf. flavescens]